MKMQCKKLCLRLFNIECKSVYFDLLSWIESVIGFTVISKI
jgi:hypothetical protein